MKAMKFKVDNELQSKLLQEALFKNGYLWVLLGSAFSKEPRYTKSTYLFANEDGYLTHSNHPDTFDRSQHEHWGTMCYINGSSNWTSSNDRIALVEVLGEIYNKKELEVALSKLTSYSIEK